MRRITYAFCSDVRQQFRDFRSRVADMTGRLNLSLESLMTSLKQFPPGAAVAPRAVEPSTVQCFLFSAATWNSHRIHYDESYATGVEGHSGVLVPGPLQGAFLEQFLSASLGAEGDIERLQYRNTAPVVAGTPLWCEAEVEQAQDDDGGPTVVFKVWLYKEDGTVTTKGRAWVRLTRTP